MENKILIKEIKKLRKEITPSETWVNFSKSSLLKQINPQNQYHEEKIGLGGYLYLFTNTFRQTLLQPAIMMLMVLVTFLGSSLSINAAFYSLPGEYLYNVKLALEKTHMALTPQEQKAQLQVEFVQKRVLEFEKIVSQPDIEPQEMKRRIQTVAKEFKNNISNVNNQLAIISQNMNSTEIGDDVLAQDKEKTLQMAVSVSEKTKELVKTFCDKVNSLPQEDLTELENIVIDVAQTVEDVNNSAEQLSGDKDNPADESAAQQGEVKGAENTDENKIENTANTEAEKTNDQDLEASN